MASNSPMPEKLDEARRALLFRYYPELYAGQPGYADRFNSQLIYYILEVVNANPGITINQVCGLLRRTLEVPEELTRLTVRTLTLELRALKAYEGVRDIKHLQLAPGYFTVQKSLAEQYPELLKYTAPIYMKKKRVELQAA